jgi:hypothetical protein
VLCPPAGPPAALVKAGASVPVGAAVEAETRRPAAAASRVAVSRRTAREGVMRMPVGSMITLSFPQMY